MVQKTALRQAIFEEFIIPAANDFQNTTEEDVEFTNRYRSKMDSLINDVQKPYYPLVKTTFRKCILLIAALLLMGSITVAAVPSLRERVIGFFIEQNDRNAEISTGLDPITADGINENFVFSEPTNIPDGFAETYRSTEGGLYIEYTNNEKTFVFSQMPLTADVQINTENANTEYVEISGNEAIISYHQAQTSIVWEDENYVYSISGDLCKSDIISMANSVNHTNF